MKRFTNAVRLRIERGMRKHKHRRRFYVRVNPLKRRKHSWLGSAVFIRQGDPEKHERSHILRFPGEHPKPRLRVTNKKLEIVERVSNDEANGTIRYYYGVPDSRDKALEKITRYVSDDDKASSPSTAPMDAPATHKPDEHLTTPVHEVLHPIRKEVTAPFVRGYQQATSRRGFRKAFLDNVNATKTATRRTTDVLRDLLQGKEPEPARVEEAANQVTTLAKKIVFDAFKEHLDGNRAARTVSHLVKPSDDVIATLVDEPLRQFGQKFKRDAGKGALSLAREPHRASAATYSKGDEWRLLLQLVTEAIQHMADHPPAEAEVINMLIGMGLSEQKAIEMKAIMTENDKVSARTISAKRRMTRKELLLLVRRIMQRENKVKFGRRVLTPTQRRQLYALRQRFKRRNQLKLCGSYDADQAIIQALRSAADVLANTPASRVEAVMTAIREAQALLVEHA